LTWQWFNNRVDKAKWQTAVWWSFYEKESGFESFLSETLRHLGVEVKASARQQLNDLLEAMRGTNILIVLDGFERLLRQYGRMDAALQSDDEDADIDPSQRDCSSPLTETFLRGLSGAGMKSKVLMTTRLCPRVLESADGKLLKGCREEPLAAFSPEDAVTYFHNEGIKATRAEVIGTCAAYGYHPLSLSLLVGLINEDHERRGDIEAVKNMEIFADVKARRHHVLERAYRSLAPERRDLLSKMSCFRGSMEYDTIKKVFASKPSGNFLTKLFKSQADKSFDLDKALFDLRKRGLLQYESETQRYDMHPIVRHYAYDHFTDEKRRKEAHVQLAMHFIDAMPVTNTKVKTLEDLAPVIELYHHMVGAGNLDEAVRLFKGRLDTPTYYQFGAYQLQIELLRALFPEGEDKPPHLKKESDQLQILNDLALVYSNNGQPFHAVPLKQRVVDFAEKLTNKQNISVALGNLAIEQINIGSLSAAERNNRRRIELTREIEDEHSEAIGYQELGRVLSFRGIWQEAEKELSAGLKLFEKEPNVQSEGVIWSYRALRFLLMAREEAILDTRKSNNEYQISAVKCAQHALELADEDARTDAPTPYDYVRAHWLLGAAYRANNELTLAEENLSKALNLCRQINMVDHEADILLDLARLSFAYAFRSAPGSAQDKLFEEAKSRAEEALVITERSGYVLQGADVNLFLAELAMAGYVLQGTSYASDKEAARFHAKEALRLATCDGPPYYYKVAYEEAERLLASLNV
jgi:tetratricopeptide (TPR) repeat protein